MNEFFLQKNSPVGPRRDRRTLPLKVIVEVHVISGVLMRILLSPFGDFCLGGPLSCRTGIVKVLH